MIFFPWPAAVLYVIIFDQDTLEYEYIRVYEYMSIYEYNMSIYPSGPALVEASLRSQLVENSSELNSSARRTMRPCLRLWHRQSRFWLQYSCQYFFYINISILIILIWYSCQYFIPGTFFLAPARRLLATASCGHLRSGGGRGVRRRCQPALHFHRCKVPWCLWWCLFHWFVWIWSYLY